MDKKQGKNDKINVIEEQIEVNKQVIEKGKVTVSKKVLEEDEKVDITVAREEVQVHKVPVNEYVESVPEIRSEGNTTIIPVIKEVAVVVKKLLLVEEIHVTKTVVETQEEKTVPLRKEEVKIERSNNNSAL
jgi:uncharacterized protein (TIGR02271 family)